MSSGRPSTRCSATRPPAGSGGSAGPSSTATFSGDGDAIRAMRHLLLPALWALQSGAGWISPGGMNYVCQRLDVAPADAYGVATFYAMFSLSPQPPSIAHVCDDIACRLAGAREIAAELEGRLGPAGGAWRPSPCLGLCERAPAVLFQRSGPGARDSAAAPCDAATIVAGLTETAPRLSTLDSPLSTPSGSPSAPQTGDSRRDSLLLLSRVGRVDPTSLDAYRAHGGYEALRAAFALGPDGILRETLESKLMGRGGAAFPAGRKWEAVARQTVRPHYIVCNADESEPGTFKDRVLMEEDPFALVESMTIVAFATGCERGFVYVRGEYPLADRARRRRGRGGPLARPARRERHRHAVRVRHRGAPRRRRVHLRRGDGALQLDRGLPRRAAQQAALSRPVRPLPQADRHQQRRDALQRASRRPARRRCVRLDRHAAVDRPEALLPVRTGRAARRLRGCRSASRCASSSTMAGGMSRGEALRAVLLGGAAGSFVGPEALDVPLTFEGTRAIGASLGSGVVMVFDETVDLADIRAPHRGLLPRRVLRPVRPLPRRHGAAGGARARTRGRAAARLDGAGDRTARRDGAGDARRVHLRTRPDGVRSDPVGDLEARRLARVSPRGTPRKSEDPRGTPREGTTRERAASGARAAPARAARRADHRRPGGRRVRRARRSWTPAAPRGSTRPTLCYLDNLTPVNVCRVCVVELEGSRVLVPACSRKVEPKMAIRTDSERVRLSRKMVLEFLGLLGRSLPRVRRGPATGWRATARTRRATAAGPARRTASATRAMPGTTTRPSRTRRRDVAQPVKVDNDLYVRDYASCILCYKCVQACGVEAQNTFAIAVAGRGFDARISTEFATSRCPIPRASTAATASASARPAR